jgi:dTDP-L-rhamnose 4-epimerase
MKILITGGVGFIGSHLAQMLLKDGNKIRILDNLNTQIHGNLPTCKEWLFNERVEFIKGSITDRRTLESSLDGITHIVHLASETGTGQSMYEIERYNEVNTLGTALLLDIIANQKKRSVTNIVLASSRSVYGEGAYVCNSCPSHERRVFPYARNSTQLSLHKWDPVCPLCGGAVHAVPTQEDDPVLPKSIYAATKYAQEDLVRIACESLGISNAILRLQNVYGEGQSLNNPYTGIISIFSTRIRRGFDIPIFEDGMETRDFIHVEDVALAIRSFLYTKTPINQIMNIGSGIGHSVLSVAQQLIISLGGKVAVRVTGEYRIGDIRHNIADIRRIQKLLPGFPQIEFASGIRRFTDWVIKQPLPQDLLDQANSELRERNLMV